jgi:hypothetical protein
MSALLKSSPSRLSHWSKDFVEHLRTVHFALVLVAAVLIVTGTNTESSRLSVALTQIQQIAKLERQWSSVPPRLYEQAMLDAKLPLAWDFEVSTRVPADFEKYEFDTRFWSVPAKVISQAEPWKFQGTRMPAELESLSDFRDFWNTLNGGIKLRLMKPPTEKSTCKQSVELHWPEFTQVIIHRSEAGARSAPWCAVNDDAPDGPKLNVEYEFEEGPLIDGVSEVIMTGSSNLRLQQTSSYYKQGAKEPISVTEIHLDSEFVRIDESYLKKILFNDWRSGNFDVAFPELSSVSTGISTLEISDAVRRLESEAAAAEKSISVLGFTVPVPQLSLWGVLILLSLQLYLWLHLHELTTRIEPDAEGWNVAWVGVYRTKAALAVAVVSCLILPAVASTTLAYRLSSTTLHYRRTLLTMSWTAVLLSCLIGLFTVRRLIRLRKACLR